MAYRRSYRTRMRDPANAGKRTYRKKTAYRRRYAAKTRYPKRRGGMSTKRILNVSSSKKRNGMLSWTNTTSTGTSQSVAKGGTTVNASTGAFFVFCPTAQNLTVSGVGPNNPVNNAQRTSQTCYMRGFSENLRIQTSTSIPWFHRRVCFTIKSLSFQLGVATGAVQPYKPYVDTVNGIERLWFNTLVNNMGSDVAGMQSIMFKGAIGQDWDDLIVAPLDPGRIDIKYDKTWTIKTGNSNGAVVERKMWHKMNKNLRYDDDEQGEGEVDAYFSTDSKLGMGDYYIVDIIQSGLGGTASDLMAINANSTLYWHEK